MNKKRGQAAMEFLMTYGWAILAAVIVVGVLWYLIGDPASLAGETFQINAPLVAEGSAITTTTISMEIRNGGAQSMSVTGVSVSGCPTAGLNGDLTVGGSGVPTTVLAGELAIVVLTCDDTVTLLQGDRFNGDVVFSYTSGAGTLVQSATGRVAGRIP